MFLQPPAIFRFTVRKWWCDKLSIGFENKTFNLASYFLWSSVGSRHVSLKQISNLITFCAVMQYWGGVFCCHGFKFLQNESFSFYDQIKPRQNPSSVWCLDREGRLNLFGSPSTQHSKSSLHLPAPADLLPLGLCSIWTPSGSSHPHQIRRQF